MAATCGAAATWHSAPCGVESTCPAPRSSPRGILCGVPENATCRLFIAGGALTGGQVSRSLPRVAWRGVGSHGLHRLPAVNQQVLPRVKATAGSTSAPAGIAEKAISGEKVEELIQYLNTDLPKLFEKGELDRARFEEKMNFEDPITKYDSLAGYLFNIQLLRLMFSPGFDLQKTYQTGPNEITTRWTMTMDFRLLPWRPLLVFSGLSIYGVNPETGRFNSHIDIWDSIKDQKYFSAEGLRELLKQSSQIYGSPEKAFPNYRILVRRANFEIRHYPSFVVAETPISESSEMFKSNNTEFSELMKYVNGQNGRGEKVEGGVPILKKGEGSSSYSAQLFLADKKSVESFPDPLPSSEVRIVEVPSSTVAAVTFNGTPSIETLMSQEKALRVSVLQSECEPKEGFALVRYNGGSPIPLLQRNEVLIELEGFTFDSIN